MIRLLCGAKPLLQHKVGANLAAGLLLLTIASCGGGSSQSGGNGSGGQQNVNAVLSIQPVSQELPEWCWLASGQMVFQFFQIPPVNPNYQCGIIGVFYGPTSACFYNCALCNASAGSSANVSVMLQYYSSYATNATEELTFQFVPSSLPFQQIQSEIDARRPILVGINPGSVSILFGQSEHLSVLVGYAVQAGQDYVVVNDPFPYAAAGYPDPYLSAGAQPLQPGQYSIRYDVFVESLVWNTSWDRMTLSPLSHADIEKRSGHEPKWKAKLEHE